LSITRVEDLDGPHGFVRTPTAVQQCGVPSNHRTLAPGQRAQVWVGGPQLSEPELLFETDELLVEAPNWSLDGAGLLVNGDGSLWRLHVAAPERGLAAVHFDGLPEINNDHVLDPDGEHVYLSATDGHIYRGTLDGGPVHRVSPDDGARHFLHGVSPDGRRLAYVHLVDMSGPGRLAILEPGRPPVLVDTGRGHLDGPEWSPDGRWIYANTEHFTDRPGHAQLGRLPADGGPMELLLSSDTVDWFPHLSPDSAHATYISFPEGTIGHPADRSVQVQVVATSDWSAAVQRYPVFGGQGTLNVNSWSPDGTRFAFVAYPLD
jgi:TolB protein